MKKFLLTAALILAVVTSLTAGTLAAYNQTLDITGNAVTAKNFNFTVAGSETFNKSDIRLSPGDSVWYKMTVTNQSEMEALFNVQATLSGDLKTTSGSPVTMTLYEANGNSNNPDKNHPIDATFIKGGNGKGNGIATDGSFTFFVNVDWPYDNSQARNTVDNTLEGKTATLKVSVTGTSVDEKAVNEAGADGITKSVDA